MDQELIAYLSEFVTPRRLKRMHAVLEERTRYITLLLEDIYQPHNASAVLRSCDSCGVQDVHILEKRNSYRVNPGVELGTAQWLTLRRYRLAEAAPGAAASAGSGAAGGAAPGAAPGAAAPDGLAGPDQSESVAAKAGATVTTPNPVRASLTDLRARGYRIVATTPHTDDVGLQEFDLSRGKVALCFGTEMEGLSEELLEQVDEYLRIPMYGFVESFNVSVSAAITLYTLTQRLRSGEVNDWRLSEEERREVLLAWLRRTVKESPLLERRFRNSRESS